MQLLLVRLIFVICWLHLTFGFKGCPNLTLNYKKFPKLTITTAFHIEGNMPVDVSVRSPFYIEDFIQYNFAGRAYNTYLNLMAYDNMSTYQKMVQKQNCDYTAEYYFNYIKYSNSSKDNRLSIVYDSSVGDVFCQSKHEMSEIYLIDYATKDKNSEKCM